MKERPLEQETKKMFSDMYCLSPSLSKVLEQSGCVGWKPCISSDGLIKLLVPTGRCADVVREIRRAGFDDKWFELEEVDRDTYLDVTFHFFDQYCPDRNR